MLSKEHLCHCEVYMGDINLPHSLQYCGGEIKPLTLTYTVNQAVLVFNPEFTKGLNFQKLVELDAPVYLKVREIKVIKNQHQQIVWHSQGGSALKGLSTTQNKTQEVFTDAATYAHINLKNVTLSTWGVCTNCGNSSNTQESQQQL